LTEAPLVKKETESKLREEEEEEEEEEEGAEEANLNLICKRPKPEVRGTLCALQRRARKRKLLGV
jgi:hypothetical protein